MDAYKLASNQTPIQREEIVRVSVRQTDNTEGGISTLASSALDKRLQMLMQPAK